MRLNQNFKVESVGKYGDYMELIYDGIDDSIAGENVAFLFKRGKIISVDCYANVKLDKAQQKEWIEEAKQKLKEEEKSYYIRRITHFKYDMLIDLIHEKKVPIYYAKVKMDEHNYGHQLFIIDKSFSLMEITELYFDSNRNEIHFKDTYIIASDTWIEKMKRKGFHIQHQIGVWTHDFSKINYRKQNDVILFLENHFPRMNITEIDVTPFQFEYMITEKRKTGSRCEIIVRTNILEDDLALLFEDGVCTSIKNTRYIKRQGAEKYIFDNKTLIAIWKKVRLQMVTSDSFSPVRYHANKE